MLNPKYVDGTEIQIGDYAKFINVHGQVFIGTIVGVPHIHNDARALKTKDGNERIIPDRFAYKINMES